MWVVWVSVFSLPLVRPKKETGSRFGEMKVKMADGNCAVIRRNRPGTKSEVRNLISLYSQDIQ